MGKKWLTSSEYTRKCQDRMLSAEKLTKVRKQEGDRKVVSAELRYYRKIVLKRQNEHRKLYLEWFKENRDKPGQDLKTPSFKRWHAPQNMRKVFPEVFTDLNKCCNGRFYLMTHQDWYKVLDILDKKRW